MRTTTRSYIKHRAGDATYAIEADEDGMILAALDVTDDARNPGGICPHMLGSLPLVGHVEDVDVLNRTRDDEYETFAPTCQNVHHLMADLLALDKEHRAAVAAFAMASSRAASAKKDMELKAAKVHELLGRINEPKPLFEAAGV